MANFESNPGPQGFDPRRSPRLVKTILLASLVPFVAFAVFIMTRILHIAGGHNGKIALIFIPFLLVFLVMVWRSFAAVKKLNLPGANNAPPRADKPWLLRPDWAAGRIKSSVATDLGVFFFMGLIFSAIGSAISFFALRRELAEKNYAILAVLLFPAVGIYLLTYAFLQWRGQRRFGGADFVMSSVPAALGGALEGTIQTGPALRLEQGLRLRVSCIRRVVTRGENSSTSESVLWQDEKILKNDAVSAASGRAAIPVYFRLPADQPECSAHGNESILWRLDAKARMAGPDFKAVFAVPVFNVSAATAGAQAADPDRTAALQMPIEEVRRDEHSKIQVSNAPDGREFYFPAARNFGTAMGVTVALLILVVACWLTTFFKAPMLFTIGTGFFCALFLLGFVNLWFKRVRVTINASRVRVSRHWLIFGGTRTFDAGDVAGFETATGLQSGQKVFRNIQLVTRTQNRHTVATTIPSQAEADWLAQEMTKALGRRN